MNRTAVLAVLLAAAAPAAAQSTYNLTVTTSGPVTPFAVVTSTPYGIVCPGACTAAFSTGTVVTLGEINPSTVAFIVWGGAPNCTNNFPTCPMTMIADSTVTVAFDPVVQVSISGSGIGYVEGPGGFIFGGNGKSNAGNSILISTAGAVVKLTASTGDASTFVGWSGDTACGSANPCAITVDVSKVIIATFTANGGPYALAVNVIGEGAVTSTPAGINCGDVCISTFTAGTSVHLATAAAAGYYFAGWANGGCSGTTTCVVLSSSPLQGLGGNQSPSAFFYSTGGTP